MVMRAYLLVHGDENFSPCGSVSIRLERSPSVAEDVFGTANSRGTLVNGLLQWVCRLTRLNKKQRSDLLNFGRTGFCDCKKLNEGGTLRLWLSFKYVR